RTLTELGLVIDTVIKNGANSISQLTFKLENEETYYKGALQLALQNANEKVQALAVSLRLSHLPIAIEIVEESVSGPILYKTYAMSAE
ncbi:SIMPL domain-containing protein, partial [Pseudoalteromonas sp. SIMBA_162]|uniref:SIMPL domain-containing protein n=1 Tax=Pseudoalteromonas sp. SIMBA_162 TaxID=3080867 RepID=UPI00397C0D69